MKQFRKWFGVLLALCMVLSLLPAGAVMSYAEDVEPAEAVDEQLAEMPFETVAAPAEDEPVGEPADETAAVENDEAPETAATLDGEEETAALPVENEPTEMAEPANEEETREAGAVVTKDPADYFVLHQLELGGQIGVHFIVDLQDMTGDQRDETSMSFTVNGETTIVDGYEGEDETNRGYICYINSAQMADPITAVLKDGSGEEIARQTYSAKDYIASFDADDAANPGKYTDVLRNLVHALADYGHYVQPFVAAENGWTVGEKHVAMPCARNYSATDVDEAKTAVAKYRIVRDIREGSGIASVTYQLNLESETSIYLYVRAKDAYTGTVDVSGDDIIVVDQSAKVKRIEITNIAAQNLGSTFEVTVTTGEVSFPIKVSALSYVDSVLNSETYAADDVALYAVTSLYNYWKAARAYIDSQVIIIN